MIISHLILNVKQHVKIELQGIRGKVEERGRSNRIQDLPVAYMSLTHNSEDLIVLKYLLSNSN